MSVFLDGVAARFYRGIGPETQFIGPFSKVNFFIGANNNGKSIVLNLLNDRLATELNREPSKQLDAVETYRGRETGKFVIAVGVLPESVRNSVIEFERKHNHIQSNFIPRLKLAVDDILDNAAVSGLFWTNKHEGTSVSIFPQPNVKDAENWTDDWNLVWRSLTNRTGGGATQQWIPQTLEELPKNARPNIPPVHLIPAKRQLGEKGESFDDLSGRGLIDHLASLQNPSYDKQSDRDRFERINAFLREITGKSEAKLEVPSDREHLLVHMDNKVLPLSALGTGIHEVILIAAFCTIHDENIMCIEEPEIHLHPLLQRKLISYLAENTESQYFIATHSSAFIDTVDASIFHVHNDGSQTYVNSVLTKNDQRSILDDLGCQASDILQSNAVIWVEGPSDRIYLKHWIEAVDARLLEGTHYTIMFYGGALIRHLTASDEALNDFIKLRDLNRHMAIVIDSDRSKSREKLKPHAQRLKREMSEGPGVAWVTAGREVENYIDGNAVQAALKIIHPKIYKGAGSTGRYDNSFHFLREDPEKKGVQISYAGADKVGLANLLCEDAADLSLLDLRERITELVKMIREANNLS
ncbi:MAG: AAA family ATPase [Hyphomicrobiales bacterium]|jgi:predicted ATPase